MSVFGVWDPKPQKFSAFLRLDFYNDPCGSGCAGIDYLPISGDAKFTTTIGGIEYYIHPSVRFSPNVEWVTYGTAREGRGRHARGRHRPPGDLLLDLVGAPAACRM